MKNRKNQRQIGATGLSRFIKFGGAVAFALLLCFGYASFDASAKKSRSSRKTSTTQTQKHKKKHRNKAVEIDSVSNDVVAVGVVCIDDCDDGAGISTVKDTVCIKEIPRPMQSDPIFTAVETPPQFPGGMSALMEWLNNNVHYPVSAMTEGVQGRVIVRFVVNKDGSIEQASVVRGVYPDLDKEALRVINSMPKWIPGMNGDKVVRSYFNVPVTFKLQDKH